MKLQKKFQRTTTGWTKPGNVSVEYDEVSLLQMMSKHPTSYKLLDTGASESLVYETLLKELPSFIELIERRPVDTTYAVAAAFGDVQPCREIAKLKIEFSKDVSLEADFIIIPEAKRDKRVILGLPLLHKLNYRLDKDAQYLTLADKEYRLDAFNIYFNAHEVMDSVGIINEYAKKYPVLFSSPVAKKPKHNFEYQVVLEGFYHVKCRKSILFHDALCNDILIEPKPLSNPSVGDTSLASTVNLADHSNEKPREPTTSFQYQNTNAFPSFSGFDDADHPKLSLLETSRLARNPVIFGSIVDSFIKQHFADDIVRSVSSKLKGYEYYYALDEMNSQMDIFEQIQLFLRADKMRNTPEPSVKEVKEYSDLIKLMNYYIPPTSLQLIQFASFLPKADRKEFLRELTSLKPKNVEDVDNLDARTLAQMYKSFKRKFADTDGVNLRVPDRMKLLEGTVNLKGQAKDWLARLKQEKGTSYTWTQFKADLLEEYCDVNGELARGASFAALTLTQGQLSVDEYSQKFRALAALWFPHEDKQTWFMRFTLGLKPAVATEIKKLDSLVKQLRERRRWSSA
ncbi:hypothetical protein CANINC_000056 [Pichia inconspicua]|uniref:Retrotransposon gag domain-containing protein n=1 Tax=Pichia inconspicua TaxID=52247 RepID=A0A4T0X7I1_9ASCO|nr:hypothetical protein CANINC_000056 [[Candida] inconspicua]